MDSYRKEKMEIITDLFQACEIEFLEDEYKIKVHKRLTSEEQDAITIFLGRLLVKFTDYSFGTIIDCSIVRGAYKELFKLYNSNK
jgi:hypothetical protein